MLKWKTFVLLPLLLTIAGFALANRPDANADTLGLW